MKRDCFPEIETNRFSYEHDRAGFLIEFSPRVDRLMRPLVSLSINGLPYVYSTVATGPIQFHICPPPSGFVQGSESRIGSLKVENADFGYSIDGELMNPSRAT